MAVKESPEKSTTEVRPFFRALAGFIWVFFLIGSIILLLIAAFVPNAPWWRLLIPLPGAFAGGVAYYRIWRHGRAGR
jgi:hypothetical protein